MQLLKSHTAGSECHSPFKVSRNTVFCLIFFLKRKGYPAYKRKQAFASNGRKGVVRKKGKK